MKNWQNGFTFLDNCIQIGSSKFSLLLREYSQLAVNVLKNNWCNDVSDI